MYHPNTLGALAQAHREDLLRESSGSWRLERPSSDRPARATRLVAHPRLVTAAVGLLVALGVVVL